MNAPRESPSAVRQQYERWPYPHVPLLARVHREQLWQLNLAWLAARCGRPQPLANPRIWIAGCGTFQPLVFALANPGARILATDLSSHSVELARRRCRWHGIRSVSFASADLEEESQCPAGPFDHIECYGVLMSLRDPGAALRRLASRLAPGGILRLMVYPHYGRQRILQIQRLARLLGLRFDEPRHPLLLRDLMGALPESHPLSYSFFHYHDSRNAAGIVDGFLHASDRAFTAIDLATMAEEAGLTPAFFFHRPWGQPGEMARKLGMEDHDPSLVLHYLDLWQELRTNLIPCFVRSGPAPPAEAPPPARHPLLDLSNAAAGLRHRARLLRLCVTGGTFASRTHESPLRLRPAEVRALLRGSRERVSEAAREILPERARQEPRRPDLSRRWRSIVPGPFLPCRAGPRAPNPLYAHLFEAFTFGDLWGGVLVPPLPSLGEQLERWRPHANPLEDETHPFGLTPLGTRARDPEGVRAAAEEARGNPDAFSFSELRLPDEEGKRRQVLSFLGRLGLPRQDFSEAELRELWVLLFSFPHLFLNGERG